ncbi:hypothetical protein I4U23_005021 [Adineta vaga]|nr:hypothetical protein I4U23_005021 [Adineta vaga]
MDQQSRRKSDRIELVSVAHDNLNASNENNYFEGRLPNNTLANSARVVKDFAGITNTPEPTNHTEENFLPLIDYAKEPLLPLYKACVPLENIIHDLSKYVKIALGEIPEQPPDGLTIDESPAIRLYTIEWDKPHPSFYRMLNQTLKILVLPDTQMIVQSQFSPASDLYVSHLKQIKVEEVLLEPPFEGKREKCPVISYSRSFSLGANVYPKIDKNDINNINANTDPLKYTCRRITGVVQDKLATDYYRSLF